MPKKNPTDPLSIAQSVVEAAIGEPLTHSAHDEYIEAYYSDTSRRPWHGLREVSRREGAKHALQACSG